MVEKPDRDDQEKQDVEDDYERYKDVNALTSEIVYFRVRRLRSGFLKYGKGH